jgi:nucleoside-diphosphate-sugar epimerase
MTAHYLVTGSAGFIGSRVSQMLLANGHRVTGIDNLNDAYDVRLKRHRLSELEAMPEFTFHRVDICDRDSLESVFQDGFDAVINLAARAGVRQSVERPHAYFDTNLVGTLNLLALCRGSGVSKFVQASTSSLYGSGNGRPFREDSDTDRPLSPYAASKKAAESICYTYHHLYGIDVTVLRYFTVYGPAGRPDMSLFRFVQWIFEGRPVIVYGDGTQTRDFTYVDDVARGTVEGLKPVGFEVVNLGSDRPVVVNNAIHMVEEYVGNTARIQHQPTHPADVSATWADIRKARHLLGWCPRVAIEDGLANAVAWYRDNRDWAKDVVTA